MNEGGTYVKAMEYPVLTSGIGSAEELYNQLENRREPYLRRGRDASEATLPMLLPRDGYNSSTEYPTPESGFGAQAINSLAAKLGSVILPPDAPFFRLEATRPEEIDKETWAQIEVEAEQSFVEIENAVMASVDKRMIRADTIEAMKYLITTGNVLIKSTLDTTERIILYPLSSYVVERDPMGRIIHIVMCESTSSEGLPDEIMIACDIVPDKNQATVDIYTRISLHNRETTGDGFVYEEYKEINGKEVPNSRETYGDQDPLPYMPLRWEVVAGESYGRGLVEQYQGDIIYMNEVTGALKDASIISSSLKWLVNPNGSTDIEELTQADNGGFVSGELQDVQALQVQKNSDLQVPMQFMSVVEKRLSEAFLLATSTRRDAERVTAYEVSVMKQELDTNLGGVYSTLSQEYQVPLLNNLMYALNKSREIPLKLKVGDNQDITVKIIGGVIGLGRGNDLQRYAKALELLAAFAPEKFAQSLKFTPFAKRVFVSAGINDTSELLKSEEELQQEQMQQMMQQLMQNPEMLNQVQGAMQGAQGAPQEAPPQQPPQ